MRSPLKDSRGQMAKNVLEEISASGTAESVVGPLISLELTSPLPNIMKT